MLVTAVVLAAALQGELNNDLPAAMAAVHDRIAQRQAARERSKPVPIKVYQPKKKACETEGLEFTDLPAAPPAMKKLGDLPPANHTLTVLRTADGCPVSSTVRYNVDIQRHPLRR